MKHHLLLFIFLIITSLSAQCDPLPIPDYGIIEVYPGDDVRSIVLGAPSGSVILFNSGTYPISSTIFINQDRITLMSKAQCRDSVILDGNQGGLPLDPSQFTYEIVAVRGSAVTLAHLSIGHAQHHGIHSYPSSTAAENVTGIRMYDIRVFDCGQQLIKVNSNGNSSDLRWVDDGVLEHSLIEFTDNSVMEEHSAYFYTGGIDVHGGENWIIRNNVFRNIERGGKLMEHAVHFWSKSRGTIVENNLFHNVYRAVGFGMKTEESSDIERIYPDNLGNAPYYDHIDGIIRNNVVYNESFIHLESGIELSNAHNAQVYNNTIFSEDTPFSSIEYRWDNSSASIKNNLVSHNILERSGANAELEANIENATADLFVHVQELDFHLSPTASCALGTGVELPLNLFGKDMDGELPDDQWDIGADQVTCVGVAGSDVSVVHAELFSGMRVSGNRIQFNAAKPMVVKMQLYDLKGNMVRSVEQGVSSGSNTVAFTASKPATGVYILKLSGGGESIVQRLFWK